MLSAHSHCLPTAAASMTRTALPTMGFSASPKELSDDPTIPEALAMAAVERAEREARVAMMSTSGFIPGGQDLMRRLPGAGPFGFFDPCNLTPECQREAILWREAELTHGRVSMMAALGFLVQERSPVHWIAPRGELAINELGGIPIEYASLLFFVIAWAEVYRAQRGWAEPDFSSDGAYAASVRSLRSTYSPGALGFDPLGLKPASPEAYLSMQEKELNNGRLSMIAVAGFVGQELATGKAIFAVA